MSRWGERLKKVEQLAQSFQLNPLASRYKPRLWPCQPSSVWKLFPRQSMAISFTQSCKEAVHVFALEKEKRPLGQRMYLVTSYSELWHYYRTYTQSLMHCYEVIPEGSVCKLYFDLEFHKPSNNGADGKTMVSSLIQHVCEKLMEVYGIECTANDVLNLDSSTEEKFSRHLIFNLHNAAFKDNIHVGRFIHSILQPVLKTPQSGSCLNVGMNRTHAVSEGKPSKPGEMAESPQTKRRKQEETELRFLQVKNKDGKDGLFVDLGQRILTWDSSETKEAITLRSHCQQGSSTTPDTLSGCLSSPYQEVDNFVLTVVKKDGIHGSIRRWNYFAAEQLLVYDITKYRWCENVERFHKSNNIMIIVDLKEEVWYQKCHDPECKNFRSSNYPLPQEICVSYIMTLDDEDQAYMMDDAGNIEPSRAPNQVPQSTACPGEESADVWGDGQDEQDYLESLDDYEQKAGDVSDELLLQCMADFDSQ